MNKIETIEDEIDRMKGKKEPEVKEKKQEKTSSERVRSIEKNPKDQEEKNPKDQEAQKEESISKKSWTKIILWTLIGIGILCAIVYYVIWPWIANLLGIEIPGWVFQVIVIVFFIWFLTWIRIVNPQEHGLKVFFGNLGEEYADKPKPDDPDPDKKKGGKIRGIYKLIYGYCKSGLHIVPRLPGCGIIKMPTQIFELSPEPRLVISKRTEKNGERYGKQFLLTELSVYTQFGRDYWSLVQAVKGKIPDNQEGLTKLADSLIDSSMRDAAGDMDWATATEKNGRDKIGSTIIANIRDPNSVFTLGGLDTEKAKVAVRAIDLENKALKKAMAMPDYEKFQREGAEYEAARIKIETQVLGEIRKELSAKGFSEANVDKIAHDIYELQITRDLQEETGMQVVKLIRFQSNSALGSTIGEGAAAAGAVAGIMAGETMKSGGKSSEKKKEEKEDESEDRKAGKALIERYSRYS